MDRPFLHDEVRSMSSGSHQRVHRAYSGSQSSLSEFMASPSPRRRQPDSDLEIASPMSSLSDYTKLARSPSDWEFAGWGRTTRLSKDSLDEYTKGGSVPSDEIKLGQLKATAISGNDITSSCLYVSGLCATEAGIYAPFALALVAFVLYLYRKVYSEVGSALPLNGGAYNVLLNTTSKQIAAVAACLTLLSYVATAVVSASSAIGYLHNLFSSVDIMLFTILLLAFFAVLTIWGISESANVALVIFSVHMVTLATLIVACITRLIEDRGSLFSENWHVPNTMGVAKSIFYGFCTALLGISGFESSANFIEQQKEGVFPKTLRNMWGAVAILNPLLSLLSFSVLPIATVVANEDNALLATMAKEFGVWLHFGFHLMHFLSYQVLF